MTRGLANGSRTNKWTGGSTEEPNGARHRAAGVAGQIGPDGFRLKLEIIPEGSIVICMDITVD